MLIYRQYEAVAKHDGTISKAAGVDQTESVRLVVLPFGVLGARLVVAEGVESTEHHAEEDLNETRTPRIPRQACKIRHTFTRGGRE